MSVPTTDNLLARRHETCALGVEHDPCRSCLAINAAADLLEAIDAVVQAYFDDDPWGNGGDYMIEIDRLLHRRVEP